MWKCVSFRWLQFIAGMAFCWVAFVVFVQASTKEYLRAELIRLQNQSGLSLVSFGGAGRNGYLHVVSFASRSLFERQLLKEENVGEGAISSDGTEIAFELRRKSGETLSTPTGKEFPKYSAYLGIVRQDGSDLQEYPALAEPAGLCWSLNGTALALSMKNLEQGKEATHSLQILNLTSGTLEEVDVSGYVTSQCWSPNSKELVYQADRTVRVYDTQEQKSWKLTDGRLATWSPDGNWIAFFKDDCYYTIRPTGKEMKPLFKKKDALTALWWSPDSRFVAYVSRNHFSEGSWWPPMEQGRLRVRRLDDNAEDWEANLYIEGHVPNFQWVKGMGLIAHAELIPRIHSLGH